MYIFYFYFFFELNLCYNGCQKLTKKQIDCAFEIIMNVRFQNNSSLTFLCFECQNLIFTPKMYS